MSLFKKKKKDKERMDINALAKLIGKEDAEKLKQLIKSEEAKPPKIAVIGKSGVGKTTTINNLFDATWKTSHSVAGTKKAQLKNFELAGGGTLSIYDMPGLGEDIEEDKVYEEIYRKILPDVDVVLWVIQANARDLAEDQRIIKEIVLDSLKESQDKLVIGLNQVDKIGPGKWNDKLNFPSEEQEKSIEKRSNDIIEKLSSVTNIKKENFQYYSAIKRFRLYPLLTTVIKAADDLGWKFPIQPKDQFELADKEVQEYVKNLMNKKSK